MADGDSFNEVNSRRRKAQFFLGTTNKRAKTVVLQIDGLDDTVRFTDVLHKMAGEVVSQFSLQSLANILKEKVAVLKFYPLDKRDILC